MVLPATTSCVVNNPAGGLFDPADGIIYDGGSQTGVGDTLEILGGTADSVEHIFVNESDGQLLYDGETAPAITYVGLEPVIDTITATDRTFTFTGGSETIDLGDDAVAGNNQSMIDSTLGESVVFVNPTNSLTVNSGSGDDVINVGILDSMYAASLIIDAGLGVNTLSMNATLIQNTPGRGLHLMNIETGVLTDVLITDNTADIGAGILIEDSDSITISSSSIQRNSATGTLATQGGGGIFNDGADLVINSGTTILNNLATSGAGSGGGIFNAGGTLSISDATIGANSAARAGGGIESWRR